MIGSALANHVRDASIALYERAAAYALTRGIIIADTKFEFGLDDGGTLTLMDEVLTPDSSRYWPVEGYAEGVNPPSYDKQFVRDWLESVRIDGAPWNKKAPAPAMPVVPAALPAPVPSVPAMPPVPVVPATPVAPAAPLVPPSPVVPSPPQPPLPAPLPPFPPGLAEPSYAGRPQPIATASSAWMMRIGPQRRSRIIRHVTISETTVDPAGKEQIDSRKVVRSSGMPRQAITIEQSRLGRRVARARYSIVSTPRPKAARAEKLRICQCVSGSCTKRIV